MCFEIVKIYFVENIIFKVYGSTKKIQKNAEILGSYFHSNFAESKLINNKGTLYNIDVVDMYTKIALDKIVSITMF